MKRIETFVQATLRVLFILIALPAFALAGIQIDNSFQFTHQEVVRVIALFISAFVGGISSAFIRTSFDKSMSYPHLAKVWAGTGLGTLSGLLMLEYFKMGLFSCLLPAFLISSLGAPIMVFYLVWFSNEEMQHELKQKIKDKMGIKNE